VRRFSPNEVGVWRVRKSAINRLLNAALHTEESFRCSLACDESLVAWINITCEKIRTVRVRSCNDDCWNIENVRRKSRSSECANELARRHENFAAEMPALFF
jgi:hypothetical protein